MSEVRVLQNTGWQHAKGTHRDTALPEMRWV